ncbi:MAG: hypothetical protein ACUVUP_03445 [Thermaceae bacterium]
MLNYIGVSALFSEEEREIGQAARHLEAEALPCIRDWWEERGFPIHLATIRHMLTRGPTTSAPLSWAGFNALV